MSVWPMIVARTRLSARAPYCGADQVSEAQVEGGLLCMAASPLPLTYLVLEIVLAQVSGLSGTAISVGQGTLSVSKDNL